MFESEIIQGFPSGIDTTALYGSLPKTALRVGVNLLLDRDGGARLIGGQEKVFADSVDTPILSFSRYRKDGVQAFVYQMGSHLWAYDRLADTHTDLGSLGGLSSPIAFAQARNSLFFSHPYDYLFFWDGDYATDHNDFEAGVRKFRIAGWQPYTFAPESYTDGAGNLVGTNYQWYVTFYDADLLTESNPSIASNGPDVAFSSQKARIHIKSLQGAFEVYIPQRTTHFRIYRVGGNIAVPRRVLEIPVDTTNFTLTTNGWQGYQDITDNVADDDVGIILMETTHNPPPIGMDSLILHKNRLFGACSLIDSDTGDPLYPARLYYSTRGQFEYFPQADSGLLADGGFIDIDDDHQNAILSLASTGSILVIGRTSSVHALLGSNASNWQPSKRSDVGVVARRSFVRCGNRICWLGTDRKVYQLGDSDPEAISGRIDKTLKDVPENTLPLACAAYYDGRYILIIPQQTDSGNPVPVAFAYDFDSRVWEDLSAHTLAASQVLTVAPLADTGTQELIIATEAAYTDAAGTAYNGLIRTSFELPVASGYIPFHLTTGEMDLGHPGIRKRLQAITIEGSLTLDPDTSTVVTLTSDTGHTRAFNLTAAHNGFRLNQRIGASLTGNYFTVDINGKGRNGDIRRIELFYSVLGEMGQ